MTFLPVVERELRVAARRRNVFWARQAAASAAVLCGAGGLWFSQNLIGLGVPGPGPIGLGMPGPGPILLGVLRQVAFAFCLLAGPIFTADVLSEERREGTLGLLFLTNLHGHDVVLGKLAAASVTAVFSLLAVLPVLAIPILLGGVPLGEFVRTVLVLGNTLFLSLAIGICMSACCVQARSALTATGFVLFLLAGVAPWIAEEWRMTQAPGWLNLALIAISPTSVLSLTPAVNYASKGLDFWLALTLMHGLAWLLLGAASWLTARVWREPAGWLAQPVWRRRWSDWNYGMSSERRRSRARLLEGNPVAWLGRRHLLKRRLLWVAVGVALVAWILFWMRRPQSAANGSTVFLFGLLLLAPLKWLAASEASQRWVADQQSGALELLLTTPLTVGELLGGQLQSLRYLFGWPVAAILVVQAAMLALLPDESRGDRILGAMALVGVVTCLWDFHTLGWVAMWLGLTVRRANRALLGTVVRVLVAPWLVFGALVLATVGVKWYAIPLFWLVVCVASNLLFHVLARHRLMRGLRRLAVERFAAAG